VLARVNASIQEAVTGISIAKNFRQEAAIYNSFVAVNEQSYQVNLRRGFVLSNVFPVLSVTSSIGIAALLYWGGVSVSSGLVTVGAWFLFMASVDRFWFPVINLSVFWSQLQIGLSAAERIFALIDAQPLVQQTDDRPVPDWAGEFDAHTWAQFMLKFVVAHPAVTVAAPGTGDPAHMVDNLGGGRGRLPTEEHLKQMLALVESLPGG